MIEARVGLLTCQRGDGVHLSIGELEVEDVDVGGQALGVGDLYPRYLEMAIRGLQSGELPGRALTTDETHRIMRGA